LPYSDDFTDSVEQKGSIEDDFSENAQFVRINQKIASQNGLLSIKIASQNTRRDPGTKRSIASTIKTIGLGVEKDTVVADPEKKTSR